MRAPPASNNELVAVLGFGALIAAIILYVQTPKMLQQPVQPKPPVVVVQQPPPVIVKPERWDLNGVGPGWGGGGGMWLGEGDFKHFGSMDHPFHREPRYAGHPMTMPELPHAPRPPMSMPMPSGGGRAHTQSQGQTAAEGYMMPPMGGAMGYVRY